MEICAGLLVVVPTTRKLAISNERVQYSYAPRRARPPATEVRYADSLFVGSRTSNTVWVGCASVVSIEITSNIVIQVSVLYIDWLRQLGYYWERCAGLPRHAGGAAPHRSGAQRRAYATLHAARVAVRSGAGWLAHGSSWLRDSPIVLVPSVS
eukprot:6213445-Pleurochrysis_carterae.AAC.1